MTLHSDNTDPCRRVVENLVAWADIVSVDATREPAARFSLRGILEDARAALEAPARCAARDGYRGSGRRCEATSGHPGRHWYISGEGEDRGFAYFDDQRPPTANRCEAVLDYPFGLRCDLDADHIGEHGAQGFGARVTWRETAPRGEAAE